MIWNKKFEYPTSTRALINGKRHYDVGTHEKLPSVTTILQATQSEEKRKKWNFSFCHRDCHKHHQKYQVLDKIQVHRSSEL